MYRYSARRVKFGPNFFFGYIEPCGVPVSKRIPLFTVKVDPGVVCPHPCSVFGGQFAPSTNAHPVRSFPLNSRSNPFSRVMFLIKLRLSLNSSFPAGKPFCLRRYATILVYSSELRAPTAYAGWLVRILLYKSATVSHICGLPEMRELVSSH